MTRGDRRLSRRARRPRRRAPDREQEDVGHLVERPAFARIGYAAVVDDEGRPIAVVSLTDIERATRASSLGDRAIGATRLAPR